MSAIRRRTPAWHCGGDAAADTQRRGPTLISILPDRLSVLGFGPVLSPIRLGGGLVGLEAPFAHGSLDGAHDRGLGGHIGMALFLATSGVRATSWRVVAAYRPDMSCDS